MTFSAELLKDKICVITGANRGIGAATARVFAQAGAELWLCARTHGALDKIVQVCQEAGATVHPLYFDIQQPDAVKQAFSTIHKISRGIDVLVNNAGVLQDALLGMVTEAQIQAVYGANIFGALYTSQYGARLMARRGGGSIINISSIIGTNGNAGQAVYGGSKAAVIGTTKSLAKELAAQKIRVNAIAPGFIDTDMARQLNKATFQERLDSIAMGEIGKPEDIAHCALYLASPLASYVTGQVIGVDGGMLI